MHLHVKDFSIRKASNELLEYICRCEKCREYLAKKWLRDVNKPKPLKDGGAGLKAELESITPRELYEKLVEIRAYQLSLILSALKQFKEVLQSYKDSS